MRIVLDTNVLLQPLPVASAYWPIFDAIRIGWVQLVVSTAILLEYAEILSSWTSSLVARNVLALLLGPIGAQRQEIHFRFGLITADPDDNKFVDCAIAGNVGYLVTNDAHSNVLAQVKFPSMRVISVQNFLKRLEVSE